MMFDGLNMGPGNLYLLSGAVTRSISAENPTGAKGMGALAETGTGAYNTRYYGKGWKVSPSVQIDPGQTQTLADIEGPGAIQSMWMAGSVNRALILRIYWDGQAHPSVECPLPDFFACGWYNNHNNPTGGPFEQLSSLMVCVNPNRALNCFWPMPFQKHAKITLENRAEEAHTCFYQINYALAEVPPEAAYFHARFRCETPLAKAGEYTLLDGVEGQGHYVGTALSVGLNGTGHWWGEGEVKFFLDGDTDGPTICGTGTEDYFLGAFDWEVDGAYKTYNSPYGGMYHVQKPDGLYCSQQRFSMYRWHVADPIRFGQDIRVTLQDLGWLTHGRFKKRRDDFASVAYWYQSLPSRPFPPLPVADDLLVE